MIRTSTGIHHPTDPELPSAVLQYADDTLIVARGDVSDVALLKEVLDRFTAIFGLAINYDKSTLVPIHMTEVAVT